MPLVDSQQKRMSATGVARPYLRGVYTSPHSIESWRHNIGLSYSSLCTRSVVSVFTNNSFSNQTTTMRATWDATPLATVVDGLVMLSDNAGTGFTNYSCLIRFNGSGQGDEDGISVRDGAAYASDAVITYTPGVQQAFRAEINITASTYTVFVDEVLLATDFAFRDAATNLDNWAQIHNTATAGIEVCNFAVVTTVSTSSLFRGSDLGGLSSGGPFFADPLAV